MRDRAADRALVAGLEVADERQCRGQQRKLLRERGPGQQPVLRHRRADLDLAAAVATISRIAASSGMRVISTRIAGSASRRLSMAISDLPAGEDAGLIAMLGQDRDRLFDRIRPHIVERTRLHRMPPSPAIARS